MIETYAEYGAIGVIVTLFVMLIMNLIRSQKEQSKDLDDIREGIRKKLNGNYSNESRNNYL